MKIDLTNTSAEQGKPFLKTGVYSIRILKAENKTSKAGNEMLVLQNEIVAPETVEGVGKIAGLQLFDYIVFGDSPIPKQRLKALCNIVKANVTDTDDATQLKQFVGKAVKVQLRTDSMVIKDENGMPMTDDNGQPIADNSYKVIRYIGADDQFTIQY